MNEILFEYYQGTSNELRECEIQLDKLIEKFLSTYDNNNIMRKRIILTNEPENVTVGNILTKFFKAKCIKLYWNSGTVNACTFIPFSFSKYQINNNFNKNRYTNLTASIFLYEELISICDLNSKELLSVILHEMGHNLYFCHVQSVLEIVGLVINMPIQLISRLIAAIYIHGDIAINDFLRKYAPFLINFKDYMASIQYDIRKYMLGLNVINGIAQYIMNPEKIISQFSIVKYMKYYEEKGADSLAARYGYSPDLISALYKLENPPNSSYIANKDKYSNNLKSFLAIQEDLAYISCDLLKMLLTEPHPSIYQRSLSLLTKLRNDYNKGDYPPEMKKELEDQIRKVEKDCETCYKNSLNGDKKIREGYYKLLQNLFGNDNVDYREFTDKLSPYYDKHRF